jgi:branched-chain amino acid transport system permease protein
VMQSAGVDRTGLLSPSSLAKPDRGRRWAWAGVAALGVITLIVTVSQSSYTVYVYDSILLACIGALALQILQGTAGLPSVGTAGFILIGAFSTVVCRRAGIPFPLDLLLATVVAGVAGVIVGLPALRLRALFLGIATLAAHFLAVYVGTIYQNHVPSARDSGFFVPTLFGSKGLAAAGRYWGYLLWGIVSLLVLGAGRLMRERSGRAMRMIREHEHVAPTLGIEVGRYKLVIFGLSSMAIGLEGALMAHLDGIVSVDNFPLILAFQYVAIIVIGGLDSVLGAIIGSAIVIALPSVTPNIVSVFVGHGRATSYGPNVAVIIYGILVVIFVTSSPEGIMGLLVRARAKLQDGSGQWRLLGLGQSRPEVPPE